MPPMPISERFWRRVEQDTDGCWEWQGVISRFGYGLLRIGSKWARVHRISWEIHFGQIPEGIFVCHHCDNRKCVRPDHLFLGTAQDNIRDMVSKKRDVNSTHPELHPRGETHGRAVLNDNLVRQIRALHLTGMNCGEIGRLLGVKRSTVGNVTEGKRWTHVV